ncbi:MAG: TonB-dependent receptor [Acidobacteria bacterium]|nr:TonB-dependent receptor [Acidobacteriota bacterium]
MRARVNPIYFCLRPGGITRPVSGMRALVTISAVALLMASSLHGESPATGGLQGAVSAVGPDGQPFNIPGVSLKLSGAPLGSAPLSAFSEDTGKYQFAGLPPGLYALEAGLPGFKTVVRTVTVTAGAAVVENLRLDLQELRENITVEATTESLGAKEVAPATEFKQDTLQTVPLVNERFQDALPLIPGVVRGPDGLINVKGARAGQSGLVVNSANVTDPATGEYAINLPMEAIASMQVLTNPYAAEYGKFTGGVTSIETRRGTGHWKTQFQDFFPRVRRRGGHIVGIGSVTPRLTFSGPVTKDKVKFLQSFEYRFVRTQIEAKNLPPLERDRLLESFDSFTQIDWDIDDANHLAASFSLFPQKLGFVGLNTFNPQTVTANFRQRGFFWGINERMIRAGGSLLESYFSIKQFDADVFPSSGSDVMNFAPNINSGSFFNRQDRESRRYEALEVYHFAPRSFYGSHGMKVAAGYSYTTFDALHASQPVRILRANGTRSQEIDFVGDPRLHRNKGEYLAYFQDKWSVNGRLTLEYGVRYDRDSLANNNNVAPRWGFAFLPIKDGRTVVRGGVGLFYDKIPLGVGAFTQRQARVLTPFAADGTTILGSPSLQRLVLDKGEFRTPRSVNWNVELDREWRHNLFVRVGYQQREGRRDYVLDPIEDPIRGSLLLLSSRGNARYKEFQVTARYKLRATDQIVASYVRSAAMGDLNDFNAFLGNFENPIIRRDERSRLPWDATHRFLLWGDIGVKYGIIVAPVLDIHTGFPLSILDEDRNFVGPRNRAGRFPMFASLDLQIMKNVTVPWVGKKYKARVGVKVFNLTNHFNPRDFQGNLASAGFGGLSNGVGRSFGGKFVVNY